MAFIFDLFERYEKRFYFLFCSANYQFNDLSHKENSSTKFL